MKITVRAGKAKKKPSVGDRKVIKGVEHVRRLKIIDHPLFGRCYDRSGGRDHFIWEPISK